MIKKFFKAETIEVSLQDTNGEERVFKVPPVTDEVMNRVIEIETKNKNKNNPFKTVVLELCELFECKEKDLANYDVKMLSEVLQYIWDKIKNPTRKQEG